jgi:hypothetical protein
LVLVRGRELHRGQSVHASGCALLTQTFDDFECRNTSSIAILHNPS